LDSGLNIQRTLNTRYSIPNLLRNLSPALRASPRISGIDDGLARSAFRLGPEPEVPVQRGMWVLQDF
jgi:hypothetical protein